MVARWLLGPGERDRGWGRCWAVLGLEYLEFASFQLFSASPHKSSQKMPLKGELKALSSAKGEHVLNAKTRTCTTYGNVLCHAAQQCHDMPLKGELKAFSSAKGEHMLNALMATQSDSAP